MTNSILLVRRKIFQKSLNLILFLHLETGKCRVWISLSEMRARFPAERVRVLLILANSCPQNGLANKHSAAFWELISVGWINCSIIHISECKNIKKRWRRRLFGCQVIIKARKARAAVFSTPFSHFIFRRVLTWRETCALPPLLY